MHQGKVAHLSGSGAGCRRVGLWNPCCRCLFSGIPDDMLIQHLFTFLDKRDLARASCACIRWSFLCSQPMLWRSLSTRDDRVHSAVQLRGILRRHGPAILSLRLHRAVELRDADVDALGRACPNLRELEAPLQECVTPAAWARLASALRHLGVFSVPGGSIDDSTCAALARHSLRVLRIRQSHEVTEVGLRALAAGACAATLCMLDIGSLPGITAAAVVDLVRRLPSLRSLRADNGPVWDNSSFVALCEAAPALRELDLSASDPFADGLAVTDEGVQTALARGPRAFKRLQCLALTGAHNLTAVSLAALLHSALSLRALDVSAPDGEAQTHCRVCQLKPALCVHQHHRVSAHAVGHEVADAHLTPVHAL